MVEVISSSDRDFESTQIVISRFSHIISRFCVCFGKDFTREIVYPLFMDEVNEKRITIIQKKNNHYHFRLFLIIIILFFL